MALKCFSIDLNCPGTQYAAFDMNQQQQQKALQHVNRYWGNKPCPCCGMANWIIQDKITMMPNVDGQNIDLGQGLGFIVGRCNTCSFSIFFNAATAGVTEGK
jgi:predicted nucleic-acid-binding Zn-ribbon protein